MKDKVTFLNFAIGRIPVGKRQKQIIHLIGAGNGEQALTMLQCHERNALDDLLHEVRQYHAVVEQQRAFAASYRPLTIVYPIRLRYPEWECP